MQAKMVMREKELRIFNWLNCPIIDYLTTIMCTKCISHEWQMDNLSLIICPGSFPVIESTSKVETSESRKYYFNTNTFCMK